MTYNEDLGNQLQFTAEDLEANRQGELSTPQQLKLRGDAIVSGVVIIVFTIIFVVGGSFLLLVESILGAITIAIGLFFGIFGGRFIRASWKAKHVHSVTGQIRRVSYAPRVGRTISSTGGNFYIGYRTMILPDINERTFTFYYVEHNHLLSLEETDSNIPDAADNM